MKRYFLPILGLFIPVPLREGKCVWPWETHDKWAGTIAVSKIPIGFIFLIVNLVIHFFL